MADKDSLLGCPFCGNAPEVVQYGRDGGVGRSTLTLRIVCRSCRIDMEGWPPETILRKWNTRVTSKR